MAVKGSMLHCARQVLPSDARMCLYRASAAPLLQKGAHVVITMKNTFHKQAAFDEAVRVQTKRLQHEGLCTNARVVHLLANTTKELTLLGCFG